MISQERKTQLRVEMLKEYLFGRIIDEETIYDIRDLLEDTFPSWEFPTPEQGGGR